MFRLFRRLYRNWNRSFRSTIFYVVLVVVILCLFTTQLSFGRSNNLPLDTNVEKISYLVDSPVVESKIQVRVHPQNTFRLVDNSMSNTRKSTKQRYKNLHRSVANKPNVSTTYPQLAANGKFVPSRRIVHLDLKGGAYKPTYFLKLFDFFRRLHFTGILLEWEDMFPFTGKLSKATNGYVYTINDVRLILQAAKDRNLEVIPLVQTLGHLEWVLKLEEFVHLRDDAESPTVICVGLDHAFELIKDMIDQVAKVHREFGMGSFHMGADEAFQFGFCNTTLELIRVEGSRERAMLWHLARVAQYIKSTYSVNVLAWHDMFANMMEQDLIAYNLPSLLQPVLWSYAEDLNMYLPMSTWYALKPFSNVWGASAFKGADGPIQYYSHPMHYIRNHESWVEQFNRVYKNFERIEGLIYSGWSRYDHMAILCELMPVALPQLAFSAETMLEARPMESNYVRSRRWLTCEPAIKKGSFSINCNFPGARLYEIINDFANRKQKAQNFLEVDYDFNGWLSRASVDYSITAKTKLDGILSNIDFHLSGLEYLVEEFQREMDPIYYQETIDEYILIYLSDIVEALRKRRNLALTLKQKRIFPKRPFIIYPKKSEL